jgi:hypothetical protein
VLKLVEIFVGLVLVVLIAILLYFNHDQDINFSVQLPQKFELCGKEISDQNGQYLALKNWLQNNTVGWQNTPVSYVPKLLFSSDTISINVMESVVIVNYKNGSDWSQVAKNANTVGLCTACK